MKLKIITFLFCLNAGMGQAQSTNLKSLDTQNEARGWQAVGRLDIGNRGFCSGTLIAPDLVLTAAHCVYDRETGAAYNPSDFVFRAGLRSGKAAADRKISAIAAHDGYKPTERLSAKNVAHDVALLKLSRPIPFSEMDPFALHNDVVRKGPVSIVSYGKGRADAQSRQRECQMTDRQDDVLIFDCDVTFGSSGAPVFSHLNGRGRVISVISGMTQVNGKKVALGMYLPPLIAQLKTELRSISYTPSIAPTPKVRRLGVGKTRNNTGAKFIKLSGS
jgi:protease YdgD